MIKREFAPRKLCKVSRKHGTSVPSLDPLPYRVKTHTYRYILANKVEVVGLSGTRRLGLAGIWNRVPKEGQLVLSDRLVVSRRVRTHCRWIRSLIKNRASVLLDIIGDQEILGKYY